MFLYFTEKAFSDNGIAVLEVLFLLRLNLVKIREMLLLTREKS